MKRSYESIQDWLERTGTPQRALARLAGITPPMMSMILSRSRRCSLTVALRLAAITGVPVEKLVKWHQIDDSRRTDRPVKTRGRKCA